MERSRVVIVALGCLALSGVVAGSGLHGAATAGFGTDRVALQSGAQAQIAVIVGTADDGVGGYEISVGTADSGVVAITDATVVGEPTAANVTVADDGSRATVSTSGLELAGPEVAVLTLTLDGGTVGNTTLDLSVPAVSTSDGQPYIPSVPDGTARVVVTEPGETPLSGGTDETPFRTGTADTAPTTGGTDGGQPLLMAIWLVGGLLLAVIVAFVGYQYVVT